MGTLHKMGRGVKHMDLGLGLLGFGLNAGVELGAGAAIGYAYGRYKDSTKWGQHTPKLVAGVGKISAFVVNLCAKGAGGQIAAGVLDSVGAAGLAIYGAELGIDKGRAAAGYEVARYKAGTALPAGFTKSSHLGALAAAPDGDGLTMRELSELAAYH